MLIGIKVPGWFSLAVWLPLPLGATNPPPWAHTPSDPPEPAEGPALAKPALRLVRPGAAA